MKRRADKLRSSLRSSHYRMDVYQSLKILMFSIIFISARSKSDYCAINFFFGKTMFAHLRLSVTFSPINFRKIFKVIFDAQLNSASDETSMIFFQKFIYPSMIGILRECFERIFPKKRNFLHEKFISLNF